MIQRLLRGWTLYFLLGILTVILYAPQLLQKPIPPLEDAARESAIAMPTRGGDALAWWPSGLDRETLERVSHAHPRLWAMFQLVGAFTIGTALGGLGLSLWVVGRGSVGAIWRVHPRRLPRWSLGELGRITLLTLLIAALLPFAQIAILAGGVDHAWLRADDPHPWMMMSMLILDGFVLLAIAAFAVGKSRRFAGSLGLSPRRLTRNLAVAFRGYMALFPWLFLVLFGVVVLARQVGLEPPVEPIQELLLEEDRPWVLALTALLACVVGPVVEECFFRGVAYPAIRRRTSPWAAMLITAAAFSAIHTNLLGFIPIMMLGCLLASLYERTGSLISPLAIHVLHNTFLFTLALVVRRMVEVGGG